MLKRIFLLRFARFFSSHIIRVFFLDIVVVAVLRFGFIWFGFQPSQFRAHIFTPFIYAPPFNYVLLSTASFSVIFIASLFFDSFGSSVFRILFVNFRKKLLKVFIGHYRILFFSRSSSNGNIFFDVLFGEFFSFFFSSDLSFFLIFFSSLIQFNVEKVMLMMNTKVQQE